MVTMFGVREAPGGLRLAEEASLASFSSSASNSPTAHGLDATTRPIFGSLPQNHPHRALAELLLDLVAAEHRLFLGAALQHHRARVGARARRAAEDDRLRQLLRAVQALADVAELRIEGRHVAEAALRLVELAAALEVEREAVDVLHHLVVQRRLAELVERHVELALLLEGEAEHAVGFGACEVGGFLAALRHG